MTETRAFDMEPGDKKGFTSKLDRGYTRFAGAYDVAVRRLPVWKTWLRCALPHLVGPRVLEVSFGTGYLLTQYAGNFDTYGIDYNATMALTARGNLRRSGVSAWLQQADVESLPYRDGEFDSVLNTMAFSGYPDADRAMAELSRVLKPGGRLVLIDVSYPADGNWLGTRLTGLFRGLGDLIRDMDALFERFGFDTTDTAIGGRGCIHLYVATKPNGS